MPTKKTYLCFYFCIYDVIFLWASTPLWYLKKEICYHCIEKLLERSLQLVPVVVYVFFYCVFSIVPLLLTLILQYHFTLRGADKKLIFTVIVCKPFQSVTDLCPYLRGCGFKCHGQHINCITTARLSNAYNANYSKDSG